jgi:pimeloyl-ACP methyl ester carboxylesterase
MQVSGQQGIQLRMQERLEQFGGRGAPLLFAHANGFPPGSYRKFLEPIQDYASVTGYKHRPLWSSRVPRKRLNWNYLADDMIATIKATYREPVWLMGHSMGAVISMIAATKAPHRIRGLILIDPVFLSTRRTLAMRFTPRAKVQQMPMIKKTLNRPNRFPDHQAAFDFHRSKRPYADVSDEVLWDYIHAGLRGSDNGELELAFSREWEAGVYESVPWVWGRLSRVRQPTLGLRGEQSDTLVPAAFARWARIQPKAELHNCPGGHLLPMEQPGSTAQYVIDFLKRQSG